MNALQFDTIGIVGIVAFAIGAVLWWRDPEFGDVPREGRGPKILMHLGAALLLCSTLALDLTSDSAGASGKQAASPLRAG